MTDQNNTAISLIKAAKRLREGEFSRLLKPADILDIAATEILGTSNNLTTMDVANNILNRIYDLAGEQSKIERLQRRVSRPTPNRTPGG